MPVLLAIRLACFVVLTGINWLYYRLRRRPFPRDRDFWLSVAAGALALTPVVVVGVVFLATANCGNNCM